LIDVAPKALRKLDQASISQAYEYYGFFNTNRTGQTIIECLARVTKVFSDCRVISEKPENEGMAEVLIHVVEQFPVEPGSLLGVPTDDVPMKFQYDLLPP